MGMRWQPSSHPAAPGALRARVSRKAVQAAGSRVLSTEEVLRVKNALALSFLLVSITSLLGCERISAKERIREIFIEGSDLFDPHSTQFRELVYRKTSIDERWCGEVNAKNRFGGYVGWKRFRVDIVGSGDPIILISERVEMDPVAKQVTDVYYSACDELEPAPESFPLQ